MDERLSAKDVVSFSIGFIGFILFLCEADSWTDQLITYGIGAIIIGLAYIVYSLWALFEEVRK